MGPIETIGRTRRQIVERLADNRRRERERRALIGKPVARAPDRDRPRPGIGEHGGAQQHRRIVAGERRQIERAARAPDRSRRAVPVCGGAAASGRSNTSGSIARAVIRRSPVSTISRISNRRRRPFTLSPITSPGASASRLGGNAKSRGLAAGPQILQPDFGAPLGFDSVHHRGEIGVRAADGAADQTARRHHRAAIVGESIGEAERDLARQFGLLRAREARWQRRVRAARGRPR